MIPKEFDYSAPGSLAEALAALRDGGDDAKVLAGGHSLIPMMKLRLAAPTLLVDLRRVGDLRKVGAGGSGLEIGSMVTYNGLQSAGEVSGSYPLLAECAASIGDQQVRSRGTIGGALAHADPAADMPAAILALDAVMIAASLQSSNGTSSTTTREIAAGDFFVDLLTSALEPGEILTTIRLPKLPQGAGSAYVKIRNKASHYALVGVAVVLGLDGDGTCSHASVAITGAGAHAFRASEVENALKGTKLESGDISNAAGKAGSSADINWMADLFGSAEYRQHLAHVATARAINTALERARKG